MGWTELTGLGPVTGSDGTDCDLPEETSDRARIPVITPARLHRSRRRSSNGRPAPDSIISGDSSKARAGHDRLVALVRRLRRETTSIGHRQATPMIGLSVQPE